jgi:thiamine-phosphate pyrophosphorylase
MQTPRVLLITDAAYPDETVLRVIEAAGRALPTGSFAVQLRDKARAGRADWARRVREATRAIGVAMVVNGDVKLARDVAADGVHFAGDAVVEAADGLWRSVAAHRDEDVVKARAQGVDAVLVSPIFTTPGKAAARGVAALERAVALAEGKLRVIALGGVGVREAAACFAAGAVGVAVIRALLGAEEPGAVAVGLSRRPAG